MYTLVTTRWNIVILRLDYNGKPWLSNLSRTQEIRGLWIVEETLAKEGRKDEIR